MTKGAVPYIVGSFLDALVDFSRTIYFGDAAVAAWLGLLLLWVAVQLIANIVDWIIDRRGRVLRMTMQLRLVLTNSRGKRKKPPKKRFFGY